MSPTTIMLLVLIVALFIAFVSTFKFVPQRSVYIVERLGKYSRTLDAGFHVLIPFIDKIAYKQNLKEQAIDVASQICITKDNIAVEVDGILYLQVIDPQKAIIEIENYLVGTSQLSQTTLRSVLGQSELDELLSQREKINVRLQHIIDQQTEPWGVKVTHVEVKQIDLPQEMQRAMAKQAEAERERRAKVIAAEGEFQASQKLSDAAKILAEEPSALTLRYLQTLREIATENNSTTIFPVPIDILKPFFKMNEDAEKKSNHPLITGRPEDKLPEA